MKTMLKKWMGIAEKKPMFVVAGAGFLIGAAAIGVGLMKSDFAITEVDGKPRYESHEFQTKNGKKITLEYDKLSKAYMLNGIDKRVAIVFATSKSVPAKEFIDKELPKLAKAEIIIGVDDASCAVTSKEYDCFDAPKGFKDISDIKILPTTLVFDKSGDLEGRMNGYVEIAPSIPTKKDKK